MQADVIGIVFFLRRSVYLAMLAYRWRDARPDKAAASPDACEHSRKSRSHLPRQSWVQRYPAVPGTSYQFPDYENECRTGVGKEIFCQRHNGVIGRNRHSAIE